MIDSAEGWIPREADSEKEVCIQGQNRWESERRNTGQREKLNCHAAGPMGSRDGPSESAQIMARRPELDTLTLTSHWMQAALRKKARSWARCLSSIKHNSQRGTEPRRQSPILPQLGKEC